MLEQLTDRVRECYAMAAEARARVDATDDPAMKAEFLRSESRWLLLARSFAFGESLADFTAANSERLREQSERLRIGDERLKQLPIADVRRNLDQPADILQLHEISTLLIQESNLESLYDRIIEAAITLMSSDMASMQSLDPKGNQLQLIAWKGFHPQSAIYWKSVYLDSASTCGLALSSGCRVAVSDVETCDCMAGTADLDEYRRSNIRAVQSTPLVSRSGQLLGMVSTHWREPYQPVERDLLRLDVLARQAADLIERSRAEAALRESDERGRQLAAIVESSNDSIVGTDLKRRVTSWNRGAERLFGYTAKEAVGMPIATIIPEEVRNEELAIFERIRGGERVEPFDTLRRGKGGGLIDVSLSVSPILNLDGQIVGACSITREITERKRSEERIAMLAREAEHRTKNVLQSVQTVVRFSQAQTTEELKQVIEGRIQALANAHGLLAETRWVGADLEKLVRQELAPYLQQERPRARIDGPLVPVQPNVAQAIAVLLHELATNAAKYGALSAVDGHVEIKWVLVSANRLCLTWTERDGPTVAPPTRKGFGTQVMGSLIKLDLHGQISFDWCAEGLVCAIKVQT